MAYNIALAFPQKFSTSPVSGFFENESDWDFNPDQVLNLIYKQGDPVLDAIPIYTSIVNSNAAFYYNVIVRANLNLNSSSPVQWATLHGPIKDATPPEPVNPYDTSGFVLTANNLEVENELRFNNIDQLDVPSAIGNHLASLEFRVYGLPTNSPFLTYITTISYAIKLTVLGQVPLFISPNSFQFSVLRNKPFFQEKELLVTHEGNWIVKTSKLLQLSALGTVNNSTAQESIISGNGNKTIKVSLNNDIQNYAGSVFYTTITITDSYGVTLTATVTVNIFDSDTFEFTPSALIFNASKGVLEAAAQSVSVAGFGAFTLSAPSWLSLSSNQGTHNLTFTVTPENSNNLNTGVYNDNIVLSANGKTYNLPVTYTIIGVISTTLESNAINFTKDLDYLDVVNLNSDPDNIVALQLTTKTYTYDNFIETEKQFNYILPFFNQKAQEHIGSIIHRLFYKPRSLQSFGMSLLEIPNNIILPILQPAHVTAVITIKKRATGNTIRQEILQNLYFIPGNTPNNFIGNTGILSNSIRTKRVTKNSFEILNFLVPSGNFELYLKKNTEDAVLIASQNTNVIKTQQYVFNFSEFKPGDAIKATIKTSTTEVSKTYRLIDEGNQSYHLAFINQHQVLELLECTGEIRVNSDIVKITHTYYKDLVEHIETFDSTKKMMLNINTGFIFKDDQLLIDAILRSEKAWLLFPDKPAIELSGVDKKLDNYDSEQELYDYDLEFNINRTYDAENYTF